MRKYFFLLTLTLLINYSFAQDTTSLRTIYLESWGAGVTFLHDDSTYLQTYAFANLDPSNSTTHALYMDPATSKLYAVMDSANFTARKLYEINPLTRSMNLVMDLQGYYSSLEITDNGRIFGIRGNGGSNPGAVYEFFPATQTSVLRYTSAAPLNYSRTLGFNPTTQELIVISGETDSIYKTTLDVWNETSQYLNMSGLEIHGTWFRNDTFYLSTYLGALLEWPYSSSSITTLRTDLNWVMDFVMDMKLIDTTDIVTFCDQPVNLTLNALYSSSKYEWYKDGNPVPSSNSPSLQVTSTGSYQLLTQFDLSGNSIWSETIVVQAANKPTVTLTSTDTLICPGDSILLTGSFGGSSQWYLDGNPVSGADTNTYYATAAGLYNMIKTNQNGCSDSSATGIRIYPDTPGNCESSIKNNEVTNLEVYPNPFSNSVTIQSSETIRKMEWIDVTGRIIKTSYPESGSFTQETATFRKGLYFLIITTDKGTIIKRMVK